MTHKISLLEEQLNKVNQERLSLRMYSIEDDSAKVPVDYTEIKLEIEEVKQRISEEEELKSQYEETIQTSTLKINELKTINEQQKIALQELESHSNTLDTELKEVEYSLETVLASVDLMNSEYQNNIESIENIEKSLSKLQGEIEHGKCQLKCMTDMRSSISKAAVEEQLRRRIKEEKEKNKNLKEEMKKIEYEIDLLLFKKFKDYMEADNLQVTGKKIFDVELAIDKARMKYLEDERSMTLLQKNARSQMDALSKTLDKISKEYRDLTSKYSEIQLEKLIFQRKTLRLEEKCEKIAEDIARVDKRLMRIDKFNGNASQIGELGRLLQKANSVHSSLAARRLQYSINGGFS
jgi:chromosome segregation ATPase